MGTLALQFQIWLATFKISVSRGSDVLNEILTKAFKGVIGCNYHSAYRKLIKENYLVAQFCMEHLKREAKLLAEHIANADLMNYGVKLYEIIRELLRLRREYKNSGDTIESRDQGLLKQLRDLAQQLREAVMRAPPDKKARNMGARFEKHGDFCFTFLTDPGLDLEAEPTNNAAEQTIRCLVIDRYITQRTRGEAGTEKVRALVDGHIHLQDTEEVRLQVHQKCH
jgi:hypothetical protein